MVNSAKKLSINSLAGSGDISGEPFNFWRKRSWRICSSSVSTGVAIWYWIFKLRLDKIQICGIDKKKLNLVPHKRQNERVERSSLSGDKDEKVPKGSTTITSLANFANASSYSRPIECQLLREACHQHLHAQKGDLEQSRTLVAVVGLLTRTGRPRISASAVDAKWTTRSISSSPTTTSTRVLSGCHSSLRRI